MLIDTSLMVEFLRPSPTPGREATVDLVARELLAGRALLSAVTVSELLVGARGTDGRSELDARLARIAAAPVAPDVATTAGALGGYLRRRGAMIPFPDLLVAATALWLELPLLTCDADLERGRRTAAGDEDPGDDGRRWRELQIHPASPVG